MEEEEETERAGCCERLLKFRRRRPLLGFLCLVYASQGETDKKRRAGGRQSFSTRCRLVVPAAETNGMREPVVPDPEGRAAEEAEEKRRVKRDPTGPTSAAARRRGPPRRNCGGLVNESTCLLLFLACPASSSLSRLRQVEDDAVLLASTPISN